MAAKSAIVFLLSLSLLIALSEQLGYDYFQMVYEWQPAMCNGRKGCRDRVSDKFTIFSLWPSNYSTGKLGPCSGSSFDPKKIEDLRPRLNQNWPDVVNGKPEATWANEWSYRGTCSEAYFDQNQYFSLALSLYGQYGVYAYMEKAGLKPMGKKYSKTDVEGAISLFTKARPSVRCNADSRGNKQLHQMTLCFSKDGSTMIDCPNLVSYTCPDEFAWNPAPVY